MKDICCIGHVTLDKIVTPKNTVYMPGGTSYYFSYGLKQLSPQVSYQLITKVGSTESDIIEKLQRDGIEVLAHPSQHTVFFENKYDIDQNNRTQRVLAKADPFTAEDLKGVEAKVYHLGTLLADDFSPELVESLAGRGLVSIDAQGYLRSVQNEKVYPVNWKDKERVLQYTDIIKVNESEMSVITDVNDPREAARKLAHWGVKEVVITLGSYGSLVYAQDRFHSIPAFCPTEVVDATGCGDTYSAGYLYSRIQGASCQEAGEFAAAMCTLKLEHSGPFDRTVEDIRHTVSTRHVCASQYTIA